MAFAGPWLSSRVTEDLGCGCLIPGSNSDPECDSSVLELALEMMPPVSQYLRVLFEDIRGHVPGAHHARLLCVRGPFASPKPKSNLGLIPNTGEEGEEEGMGGTVARAPCPVKCHALHRVTMQQEALASCQCRALGLSSL